MKESMPSSAHPPQAARKLRIWLAVSGAIGGAKSDGRLGGLINLLAGNISSFDTDTLLLRIKVILDEIGALTRGQPGSASGHMSGARRISGGHAHGVGQAEMGEAHEVLYAAVHAQGRAGQTILAHQHDAVIGGELDSLLAQLVSPRRTTGWGGGVGDQHRAIDGLGAQRDFEERG